MLGRRRYDEALAVFIQHHAPFYLLKDNDEDPLIYTVFKIIGLSNVNASKNAYIQVALQLVKSLITPSVSWPARKDRYDESLYGGTRWIMLGHGTELSVTTLKEETDGFKSSGLRWLRAPNARLFGKLLGQSVKNKISNRRIYKLKRNMHLNNLQDGIRDNSGGSHEIWEWNRDLVFKFLIPVLDQCPKSDKLLSVINRRIRKVPLQYTARRHLRDAVYRYIRRTSGMGI